MFVKKHGVRKAFPKLEYHRPLRYLFWNFYLNFISCFGIFTGNGDPIGRHICDWPEMEVTPRTFIQQSLRSYKLVKNGGFSNFELPLLVRNSTYVASY